MQTRLVVLVLLSAGLVAPSVRAADVTVAAGESIQAAIDLASDGDTVTVEAGTFPENLDFAGKAIAVVGRGPTSVILGTGAGPVVRFDSNETPDSVLDSFTITGGTAVNGGGILIENASPTIIRNVITGNRASGQGSGIAVRGLAGMVPAPRIFNNVLSSNTNVDGLGDPHGIQVANAAPTVVNNTIVDGDSNGILLGGVASAATVILNNVIALNGTARERRGRGICDFSGGAVIQYNLFYRNTVAAVLTQLGRNFRRVRTAERVIAQPSLAHNTDRSPRFVDFRNGDFRPGPRSAARNGGHPDGAFADRDGRRNTMGHTGGPFAADAPAPRPTAAGEIIRSAP